MMPVFKASALMEIIMKYHLFLAAVLCTTTVQRSPAQTDATTPRSTTERPNVSAPGMQQTIAGVLMDAACTAISSTRSDLTRTPRLLDPPSSKNSDMRRTTDQTSDATSRRKSPAETTVPDKYRSCGVTSSTTSFALYANGKVFVLDRISNQMMQEHMQKPGSSSSTAGSRWTTLTVVGTATSEDVLTLRSIGK